MLGLCSVQHGFPSCTQCPQIQYKLGWIPRMNGWTNEWINNLFLYKKPATLSLLTLTSDSLSLCVCVRSFLYSPPEMSGWLMRRWRTWQPPPKQLVHLGCTSAPAVSSICYISFSPYHPFNTTPKPPNLQQHCLYISFRLVFQTKVKSDNNLRISCSLELVPFKIALNLDLKTSHLCLRVECSFVFISAVCTVKQFT